MLLSLDVLAFSGSYVYSVFHEIPREGTTIEKCPPVIKVFLEPKPIVQQPVRSTRNMIS
jgi:hypothetical protein